MFDARAVAALPDVLLRGTDYPSDRRPRLLATGFGGSVRTSFSGTTAFLAQAGIDTGDLDGAFTLYSDARPDRVLQLQGLLWKARQLARRESPSGFKFAGRFSAHLWDTHRGALSGVDVINNFQFYSPRFLRGRRAQGTRAFFYLDGTLHDYLRGYRDFDVAAIDPATTDRSIELERAGYHDADGVLVMCEATAQTLVTRYGLAREHVEVVLPGANMTDRMAEQVVAARNSRTERAEVTVGFVGVYPERKGLPKLAAAIAILRAEHVAVRLQVVGNCPADIAAMDGVDALGVISKTTDPDRFAEAFARIDLGVQLSEVELFGIAVLEYLRCGIPFLATRVGGIVDILHEGGGIGVAADVSVEEVAETIRAFVQDEEQRGRLGAAAAARSEDVRWAHTARTLGDRLARHA